ncbi:MAG: hypothetical protein ACP5U1_13435 [Desulfomonilaceae bacterium]
MGRMLSILAVMFALMSPLCFAGGPGGQGGAMQGPPLDYTLMGFKEQGAWYFLCTAPEYCKRIPPHYQTYGPPPPYCGVPCAAAPIVKK